MNTKDEIKRQIIAKVKATFPMYPIDVQTSPEDDESLWVQVFCVPADQVLKLEDEIFNIQDALAPAGEILLLPMVKDMAITRQYYPEYLPKEPVAAQAAAFVDLFKATTLALSKWSIASASEYSPRECYTVPRQVPVLEAVSNLDEVLQPATQRESTVPAKSNFALAA